MKRTWKDNLTAKMKLQMKKHKRLRVPLTVCVILITILYNMCYYFRHNTRRFAGVLAVIVFFSVGGGKVWHYAGIGRVGTDTGKL